MVVFLLIYLVLAAACFGYFAMKCALSSSWDDLFVGVALSLMWPLTLLILTVGWAGSRHNG